MKVLAAEERISEPPPAFTSPASVVPPMVFVIAALMRRLSGDAPEVVTVRLTAFNSNVPEIVGVLAKLSFVAVIAVAESVKVSVPPDATVGVAVPAVLLKVMFFNVLPPTSVSTPPPLIVTALVAAICPPVTVSVRFALFRMMLPFTCVLPITPPMVSVPLLTTVSPV